jgi:hypothetical protein
MPSAASTAALWKGHPRIKPPEGGVSNDARMRDLGLRLGAFALGWRGSPTVRRMWRRYSSTTAVLLGKC